ncbi:hypothetical protein K474DRAFT_1682735 [Panus rudis PR-1116 ss-1]|nr:hypothetical protein K474DRAFT_1682735 [Panus rudis PR-1116 ss-1]
MHGGTHVKAWHTNFSPKPLQYLKYLVIPFSQVEKQGISRTQWFRTQGNGYSAEQSTKPQTLGYSLADSPVGLLAWVYEKLIPVILEWVSIYWFSKAGPAASVRIYYETRQAQAYWARLVGNVVFETEYEYDTGGHFAAHEKPEIGGPAFGVVPGKSGYAAL